jgi:glyoxylase-like metal-dependent hydrolase (beta-lactamase superfamily II)
MVKYEVLVLGDLDTNCYLVWDEKTKNGVVIDPSDDGIGISETLFNKGINLVGILLTHGHFDHTLGVLDLKLIYNVPIYIHNKDKFLLNRQDETAKHFLKREIKTPNIIKIDKDLEKIKEIELGEEKLEVILTPGHTPGSVCFYWKPTLPSLEKGGLLFSGDTLFAHDRGRTDFSYGSTEKILKSLKKLMKLNKDTLVLPGHGEETIIERESRCYL